jgi:hypothetical protein
MRPEGRDVAGRVEAGSGRPRSPQTTFFTPRPQVRAQGAVMRDVSGISRRRSGPAPPTDPSPYGQGIRIKEDYVSRH